MLGNLRSHLGSMLNMKTGIIVLIFVLFIAICVYVYNIYVEPRLNPSYVANKEFVDQGASNEAELMFFYTDWCPYCKKAKPIWEQLKERYTNTPINNTTIYFKEIDCDKNETVADEYSIEGYPTIKLIKNGEIIEYDAKPDLDTLEKFLHTTL